MLHKSLPKSLLGHRRLSSLLQQHGTPAPSARLLSRTVAAASCLRSVPLLVHSALCSLLCPASAAANVLSPCGQVAFAYTVDVQSGIPAPLGYGGRVLSSLFRQSHPRDTLPFLARPRAVVHMPLLVVLQLITVHAENIDYPQA